MDVPRPPQRSRRWRWLAGIVLAMALLPVARQGALAGLDGLAAAGAAWVASGTAAAEPQSASPGPDGIYIEDTYGEWVLVGSATGLAYSEASDDVPHDSPGMFTNVFLRPDAYHAFRETGAFPEGTTLVLEMRQPASGVSIARDGWFAGELRGVHAAIKDSARFAGGWGYFDVRPDGRAAPVSTPACASCHARHAETDNVFTQFYPRLTERRADAASR